MENSAPVEASQEEKDRSPSPSTQRQHKPMTTRPKNISLARAEALKDERTPGRRTKRSRSSSRPLQPRCKLSTARKSEPFKPSMLYAKPKPKRTNKHIQNLCNVKPPTKPYLVRGIECCMKREESKGKFYFIVKWKGLNFAHVCRVSQDAVDPSQWTHHETCPDAASSYEEFQKWCEKNPEKIITDDFSDSSEASENDT